MRFIRASKTTFALIGVGLGVVTAAPNVPSAATLVPPGASARTALTALAGKAAYAVVPSFPAGFALASANPNAVPAGANVPCRLTAMHPEPVVLVHGTFEDMEDNFGAEAPILANNGYCVYTFNYGARPGTLFQAIGPIPQSAMEIAMAIELVRKVTHAAKVNVVGHSQGGTNLEYVAKFLRGAGVIDRLVAITPSTHGTTASGLLTLAQEIPGANNALAAGCQACVDQEIGSPVIAKLDAPPIAQRGPVYTVIETKTDEVITPSTNAFINEPGVTNEYIQSFCPNDLAEHLEIDYDLVAIRLVLNALDPRTASAPNCAFAFPFPA